LEVPRLFFNLSPLSPYLYAINLQPVMTLSRNAFFLLLLFICISPFVIWKLVWLSKTTTTTGKVWYAGHTLELDGKISSHLVILFLVGKDSISFQAPANLPFKEGETIPVRYVPAEPSKARVNTPLRIWGDTIVYGLWPVLFIVVLFAIPKRFDPIIPRKSKVKLSRKKLIEVISLELK
jgi:hypothetical protein